MSEDQKVVWTPIFTNAVEGLRRPTTMLPPMPPREPARNSTPDDFGSCSYWKFHVGIAFMILSRSLRSREPGRIDRRLLQRGPGHIAEESPGNMLVVGMCVLTEETPVAREVATHGVAVSHLFCGVSIT
jgi:hypothetical protein